MTRKEKQREYARKRRAANPDGYRAHAREIYQKNIEHVRAYQREYRLRNPQKTAALARKHRGLPVETRPAPLVCECCGTDQFGGPNKVLHLDHDHETKEFRGWLCNSCNLGIGHLGDNLDGILRAAAYLTTAAKSSRLSSHHEIPGVLR